MQQQQQQQVILPAARRLRGRICNDDRAKWRVQPLRGASSNRTRPLEPRRIASARVRLSDYVIRKIDSAKTVYPLANRGC